MGQLSTVGESRTRLMAVAFLSGSSAKGTVTLAGQDGLVIEVAQNVRSPMALSNNCCLARQHRGAK